MKRILFSGVPLRRAQFFSLNFLLLFLLGATWSLLFPLGGPLDDSAHTVKAVSTAYGQFIDRGWNATDKIPVVEIPNRVGQIDLMQDAADYFGSQSNVPATGAPIPKVIDNSAGYHQEGTSAGNYPPLYYFLVGFPAWFFAAPTAIYLMRIVSALLFALLVAAGLDGLYKIDRSGSLSMLALVAVTPTAATLGGVVNPQALEIGSAIALAGTLVPLMLGQNLSAKRLLMAGFFAFLLCWSRPIGPLWAGIIVLGVALVLTKKQWVDLARSKAFWGCLALGGFGVASIGVWLSLTDTSSSLRGAPTPGVNGLFTLLQHLYNQSPGYWYQLVGVAGWLDTPMGWLGLAAGTGAILLVAAYGLVKMTKREIFTVFVVGFLAVWGIVLTQLVSLSRVGVIFQGRYMLPISAAITVFFVGFAARQVKYRRSVLVLTCALLGFAHEEMIRTALRRFAVGLGNGKWAYWSELTVYAQVSVVLALLAAILGIFLTSRVWNVIEMPPVTLVGKDEGKPKVAGA